MVFFIIYLQKKISTLNLFPFVLIIPITWGNYESHGLFSWVINNSLTFDFQQLWNQHQGN